MNQPLLLHIAERLEGLLGKLPASIQNPVLHELTPLKELFLKQRAPRLFSPALTNFPFRISSRTSSRPRIPGMCDNVLMEVFRWQNVSVGGLGSVALLDARGADEPASAKSRRS